MAKSTKYDAYRKELQAMRGRLDQQLAALRDEASHDAGGENAGGGLFSVPIDPADRGSQETDAVVTVGLAENEAVLRREVEDALSRLDAGTFGVCEACGNKIDSNRLNAAPYARSCIECAKRDQ